MKKFVSIFILVCFLITGQAGQYPVFAQVDPMPFMPRPGEMVHLSPQFSPAYLKGIVVHPEDPFKFDFIIYKGDQPLNDAQKKEEYTKLTKYFLASLAIPDEDQWVNLSPYEKDRIIKDDFGKTEMGRDLLAQDYMLKQITASLIYPEDNLGKEFWNKVYAQAQKQYGTSNVPVNTFNKVWIIPDSALIYEKGNMAYVVNHHLKVMLEEDYLSLQKHSGIESTPTNKAHTIASKIVREIVLPELQREVNEDKNFAPLRQVFSGTILAAWFKRALKQSVLARIYSDKSKVKGVDQDPRSNEMIYQQYLKAYKKGVFNFIKEDADTLTNQPMPRKYFSGGMRVDGAMYSQIATVTTDPAAERRDFARGANFDFVSESLVGARADAGVMNAAMLIEERDGQRLAFTKVNSLGEGIESAFIVKGIVSPQEISVSSQRQRPEDGPYKPLRPNVYAGSFVTVKPLTQNFESTPSLWTIKGTESKGFAIRGRIGVISFTDKLVVIDSVTGKVIRTLTNSNFKALHNVEFHPINPDIVLVSNSGLDQILEVNIKSGAIVYEWSAWDHGYHKSVMGFTLTRDIKSLPPLPEGQRWTVFTYQEMAAKLQRREQIPNIESTAVLIDAKTISHPLGVELVFNAVRPNWVGYNDDGTKLLATFIMGKAVEIDKETGKVTVIKDNLSSPHGVLKYKNGYLITDTSNGKVFFLNKNFEVSSVFDFTQFPRTDEVNRLWGQKEWLQHSQPLGNTGLIATVDSYRSILIVWDPLTREYSTYPYDRNWQIQAVLPVGSKAMTAANIGQKVTNNESAAMPTLVGLIRTLLPEELKPILGSKERRVGMEDYDDLENLMRHFGRSKEGRLWLHLHLCVGAAEYHHGLIPERNGLFFPVDLKNKRFVVGDPWGELLRGVPYEAIEKFISLKGLISDSDVIWMKQETEKLIESVSKGHKKQLISYVSDPKNFEDREPMLASITPHEEGIIYLSRDVAEDGLYADVYGNSYTQNWSLGADGQLIVEKVSDLKMALLIFKSMFHGFRKRSKEGRTIVKSNDVTLMELLREPQIKDYVQSPQIYEEMKGHIEHAYDPWDRADESTKPLIMARVEYVIGLLRQAIASEAMTVGEESDFSNYHARPKGTLVEYFVKENLFSLGVDITQEVIKSIHWYIGLNQPRDERFQATSNWIPLEEWGKYREGEMYIPRVDLSFPKAEDLDFEMEKFVEWLRGEESKNENTIVLAARAYIKFINIHPFQNGNGRTGRELINLILRRHGSAAIKNMKVIYWNRLMLRDNESDVKHLAGLLAKELEGEPTLGSFNVKSDDAQLTPGGIDLNSANLAMMIKRDGKGVVLPIAQQDLAQLSAGIGDGLEPHILSIIPASQSSVFAQLVAR